MIILHDVYYTYIIHIYYIYIYKNIYCTYIIHIHTLDYTYFKVNYKLVAVNLSKQKALDADLRAIQQIVFQEVAGGADTAKLRLYTILEK